MLLYDFYMFGQVLSVVPPDVASAFCGDRDATIADALGVIQGIPVDPSVSTHTLPVAAGGAGLPSLQALAPASYLGALFKVAGPLTTRILLMGGTTMARAATLLADPETASGTYAWVAYLTTTHREAMDLQDSFNSLELHTISLVLPRGNIIQSVGDPTSTALALTPTMDVEVTPALTTAVRAPKGMRFVTARLRRLRGWRSFLSFLEYDPSSFKPKLLSHYSHGNVSIMIFDTPLGRSASPPLARSMIR